MNPRHLLPRRATPRPAVGRRRSRCHLPALALALTLTLLGLPRPAPAAGDTPRPPHVLIISSYHLGYTWSDDILAGIREALADQEPAVEISCEFLDAKRHDETPLYLDRLMGVFVEKYRLRPVDLLILCDNSAFEFVAARRWRLWADVPVVFCGINDYSAALHARMPHSTGVAEIKEMGATLDLMGRLHPGVGRVAIVADDTLTGKIDAGQIREAAVARGMEPILLSGAHLSLGELLERLRQLPPDAAVFFGSFWRDRTGAALAPEKILPRIAEAAPVPVYTHADTFLMGGVVGGVLVHGRQQGLLAGELAQRILDGARPESLPVAVRSNIPVFDHAALRRWNIDPRALPENAVILNPPPPSLYQRYTALVWAVAATFLLLVGLVAGLAVNIAFRRRAEEALRAKTAELERYFSSSLDLLCIADNQGRFLHLNPEWEKTLGYRVEDLEHRAFLDFVHPDDRPATLAAISRLNRQNPVLNFENRYRHKDGTYRWIEWRSHPQGDMIYAAARDVTQRKLDNEALRASEERFRLLAELAPVGIVISDAEEKTLYASPTFTELFGYTLEDMPSVAEWMRLAYPDEDLRHHVRREWAAAMAEAQASRSPIRPLTFPVTCRDGRVRQIEFRLKSTDALNVVIVTDVSERHEAEAELRKRELLLSKILDLLPIGLWFVDAEGRLVRSNPKGRAIWGAPPAVSLDDYDRFKARRLPSGQAIAPDDWAVMHTLREGITVDNELLEVEAGDGCRRYVANYSAPVFDDNARLMGAIILNTDITGQMEAEAERARLVEQLTHSQKMESIGRLAGGVAHDFNNMLGVILGHTELTLDLVAPGDPLHTALLEIRQAAQRSADLTRQLLAFARKQIVAPRELDLNDTVTGMLKMLRRLIGEGIELVWMPGENLGPVMIDPSQIDQILANLCVNARDAIGDTGRITIQTRAAAMDAAHAAEHPEAAAGDYLLLSVSDTGCGMSPEMRAHLFEPFFTTKAVGQGTGLGLATVYGIVTQNKGLIEVDSEPGLGTTFRIYLPRHRSQAPRVAADAPAPPAPRGRETILLVEDEPMILNMAAIVLERQGYAILKAETPHEALGLAQAHTGAIHLLMTDVVMPGMNGRDLARELQARNPGLRCLFMSGYTADIIAHHGVLDQGVHFLQKPFSIQDLTARVREALS